MILSIFVFQVKFKKSTADEEEVLGGGIWCCDKELGEWRRCRGSEGGAWGRTRCWGSGGSAGGVEGCRGLEDVQRECRRCLGAGKGVVVVVEVLWE